ncbi:MAG TPA: alpha/beta fold hydrolase [Rugosimonospora sp.]|nr:alpha/beta fold hydrolase [Rugosimonospora sp.]
MTDFALHRLREGDGRGPVVVLVHGMEDSWQSWRTLAAHLDPAWRTYALDMPWRTGNSYRWRADGSTGRWLSRALATVDGPIDLLIGHSMGANAVLELLAGEHPESVRAAAVLAPFYCARSTPVTWALFDQARKFFDRIIAEGMRIRLGPRAHTLDPQLVEAMLDKMVDRIGPRGFMAWFDHFTASAGLPLHAVAVPTLVLANADDPCLSDGRAVALAAEMPAATLWLDEAYDHFCHLGQAALAAAQLLRFARTAGVNEGNRA